MSNQNIPKHIVITPDGNRRWAKSRGFKPWIGHRIAFKHFEEIFGAAIDLKIPYFSFWISSKDNLKKRPKAEVKFLLNLFKKKFTELAVDKTIHKNQVRINVIGEWKIQLSEDVKIPIRQAIEATKNYNKFFLNFFIAYSGVDEMLNAVKKINKRSNSRITSEIIKKNLLTKDLPPVDFLIRTGGGAHMSSGFMMWDIADAELYFSDKLYPDFTADDFRNAIKDYSCRRRCFGA
ncbi:di-trans,poly-cis-decaprenylcistransferase [Candidatus Parcubacteria bacterium]|nr:di-trans,poly-cis-decaprenylcistransferase [Candidatus Parcubacteria bacterium]